MITNKLKRQRGATLIIALIMLVLLTLFALTAVNTSNTNLRIVSNMQIRSEAFNAAQQAIETVISTPEFLSNPAAAVLNPCGPANTLCMDVNGDNVPDYTVVLLPNTGPKPGPGCIKARAIKNSELTTSAADIVCTWSGPPGTYAPGGGVGDSLCADTTWEITARATSSMMPDVNVTVTQGLAVRVSLDQMDTFCI